MGTEMKVEGYDAAYKRGKYLEHYTKSRWFERFEATAKHINIDDKILEIGCGTGQLANLLFDEQKRNYKGYDFSPVAINVCKSLDLNPMTFYIANAYDESAYYPDYDTVIICEVLEHLDDFAILENIKQGTKMVISLPYRSPADNHLFVIRDEQQVIDRYKGIIDIETIELIGGLWYVFKGVKI